MRDFVKKLGESAVLGVMLLLGNGQAPASPPGNRRPSPERPRSPRRVVRRRLLPAGQGDRSRGLTIALGADTDARGCYNKARDVVLRSDILIPDLKDFAGFDCLIIPSGPQFRKFREDPVVLKFVRDAHASGLLVRLLLRRELPGPGRRPRRRALGTGFVPQGR